MTAMRLKRYPSPSGGIALGKMGVGAKMMKRLPYDAEVEYLQSTGTQYIETGFTATDSMSYKGVISPTSSTHSGGMFGYRFVDSATGYGNMRFSFIYNDGRIGLRNGLEAQNSTQKLAVGSIYDIEVDNQYVKVNGNVWISADNKKATMNPPGEMWLFFVNCTNHYSVDVQPVYMRLYSWQIFDNGLLVRDFIPVRFTNEQGQTEGAMYDRLGVGGMNPDGSARDDGLYRNRGTGAFGYGNDI